MSERLPHPENPHSTGPSEPQAQEESSSIPVWVLALVQIVPTIGLTSIAIAALVVGGLDGKDVALSATSGLAGFAAARGLTK